MVTQNTASSGESSCALSRVFITQRPIGEVVRSIESALDLANFKTRSRQDVGACEVRFDVAGASLAVTAQASFRTEVRVNARHGENRVYGNMLRAIRGVGRLREQRQLPRCCARASQAARSVSTDYVAQLARLGIAVAVVKSFADFVDAIHRSGCAIVTPKALEGAAGCVYRKPVRLAQSMVEVILRTRARTHGCCDQQLYGTLPGFRLNLSDSQRGQFRSDYVAVHEGREHLGQLHVTLGVGHSPARCASVHWAIRGVSGPVVFTRIGTHGRNAST